jgi:hypothetical protein
MTSRSDHQALSRPCDSTISERVFWAITYVYGSLLTLFLVSNPRGTAIGDIYAIVICLLWVLAIALRRSGQPRGYQYLAAVAWILMAWIPVTIIICVYLDYWRRIGTEAPDGMGSPLAFLMGLMFQVLLFVPLTVLLGILIFAKPWRSGSEATDSTISDVRV